MPPTNNSTFFPRVAITVFVVMILCLGWLYYQRLSQKPKPQYLPVVPAFQGVAPSPQIPDYLIPRPPSSTTITSTAAAKSKSK